MKFSISKEPLINDRAQKGMHACLCAYYTTDFREALGNMFCTINMTWLVRNFISAAWNKWTASTSWVMRIICITPDFAYEECKNHNIPKYIFSKNIPTISTRPKWERTRLNQSVNFISLCYLLVWLPSYGSCLLFYFQILLCLPQP